MLVRLDSSQSSAQIEVCGTVSAANVQMIYVIVARTNAFLPGMDIALDLSQTEIPAAILAGLRAAAGAGVLPQAAGPQAEPYHLRVVEPVAA